MNQEADDTSNEKITVRILTDSEGISKFSFTFPRLGSISSESTEQRLEPPKNKKKKYPKEESPKFSRKPLDEKTASKKFRNLSDSWVSVAIGFFEIVPELSKRNLEYVGAEPTNRIIALLKQLSVDLQEIKTPEGRIDREFSIPRDDLTLLLKTVGGSTPSLRAAHTMTRSSLLALLSEYENSVSELIRNLARLQPSSLIGDDEAVTISDIEQYSSFDELMVDLIDQKVTDLLQGNSHQQTLEWLEKKFGVNLTSNKELIAEFVEVCQRRHLLAHAGGIVNKKYLRICKDYGLAPKDLPDLGELLSVDRRYLRRATARVFLVGYFTLHILWQKLIPHEREESLGEIL